MVQDTTTRQNRIREALGRIYENEPPYFREYLRRFKEDPTSRVFAPLAEAYRRLGRLDDAIGLCREGLEHHPNFHGGRVALAKCLMDKRDFQGAREELERVVQSVPENLLAQRLLGEVCANRGDRDGALHCFKMALLLSPSDVQLAEKVRALERGEVLLDIVEEKEETKTEFIHGTSVESEEVVAEVNAEPVENLSQLWAVEETTEEDAGIHSARINAILGATEDMAGSDSEAFTVGPITAILESVPKDTDSEITTETLGDLYMSQGQFDQALRIFEKIQVIRSTAELVRKMSQCRASLGVDREVMTRNRQIDALKAILEDIRRHPRS